MSELGLTSLGDSEREAATHLIANQATLAYLESRPIDRDSEATQQFKKSLVADTRDSTKIVIDGYVHSKVDKALEAHGPMINLLALNSGLEISEKQRAEMVEALSKAAVAIKAESVTGAPITQAEAAKRIEAALRDTAFGKDPKATDSIKLVAANFAETLSQPLDAPEQDPKAKAVLIIGTNIAAKFEKMRPLLAQMEITDTAQQDKVREALAKGIIDVVTKDPDFATRLVADREKALTEAIKANLPPEMHIRDQLAALAGASLSKGLSGDELKPDPAKTRELVEEKIRHQVLYPEGKIPMAEDITQRLVKAVGEKVEAEKKDIDASYWIAFGKGFGKTRNKQIVDYLAPSEDEAREFSKKLSKVVADATAKAITDPAAPPDPDQLATHIANCVKKAVESDPSLKVTKQLGLGPIESGKVAETGAPMRDLGVRDDWGNNYEIDVLTPQTKGKLTPDGAEKTIVQTIYNEVLAKATADKARLAAARAVAEQTRVLEKQQELAEKTQVQPGEVKVLAQQQADTNAQGTNVPAGPGKQRAAGGGKTAGG